LKKDLWSEPLIMEGFTPHTLIRNYLKNPNGTDTMSPKILVFLALLVAMNMPVFGQYDTGTYYSNQDPRTIQYTKYSNYGLSFEYPEGWEISESHTLNPSVGSVSIFDTTLKDPMKYLMDPNGLLEMTTLIVSWDKTLANQGLDEAMNLAISQRRKIHDQLNVQDLPALLIQGDQALVKKIDSIDSDGYSERADYEFLVIFISSKTNRVIELSSQKTFGDFQDSEIEYFKHLLNTWTEESATYNPLGMPLA